MVEPPPERAFALCGCRRFGPQAGLLRLRVTHYESHRADISEQMGVCYTLEKGDCIGRIPETVFSVGWNERFIVAKQHPSNNRSVTNYFILEMARDSKLADPSASVTGPLSAAAFEERVASRGLPPFTKTIEALK